MTHPQVLSDERMAEVLTTAYGSPEWTMDDVRAARAIESATLEALSGREPVAWRDPTNTNPGQGCTYDKATQAQWPHIYREPLYLHPSPAQPPAQQEPFGYFKATPFGWTDCASTDEGAVALYERR